MQRRYAIAVAGAACAWLGSAAEARAEVGTTQFNPVKEFTATEFPWSSGFVPNSGPLQIQIDAAAFQEVLIGLPGDAHHDWDAAEIWFQGSDDAGVFINTLGAEITATIAVDIGIVNTQFEVGVWDISEQAAADAFTPYVLPGNPDRPVTVAELIGPFNLTQTPFSVAGVEGTLTIDYAFDIPGITFEGSRIDVTNAPSTVGAPDASVDMELSHEPFMFTDAEPGGLATAYGTMYGSFSSAVALHIYPTVSVVVAGLPYDIGPLDLVIDYPVVSDEEIVFDELALMLDVPEAPPPPDTTGGADDTTGPAPEGDSGGASAGDGTTGTLPEGTTGGDEPTGGIGTGLPGLDDGDSGCSCRTREGGTTWGLLGLAGFVLVSRFRGRRAP